MTASAPDAGLALQIKLMGTREQAAEKDFSGIPLEEEVEESLKESAVISMGTEISEMDLENIVALCDQVTCSPYAHLEKSAICPSTLLLASWVWLPIGSAPATAVRQAQQQTMSRTETLGCARRSLPWQSTGVSCTSTSRAE